MDYIKKFTNREIKDRIDIALVRVLLTDWSIPRELSDKFRDSLYITFEIEDYKKISKKP
jgi:hypothetical protein